MSKSETGNFPWGTWNMSECVQWSPEQILYSPLHLFLNSDVIWGVARCVFDQFKNWPLPLGYPEHIRMRPMGSWAGLNNLISTLGIIAVVFEFWCNLRCRMTCFSPGQKLATSPGVPGTCLDVANVVLVTYFSHLCTCFWILMWFEVSHDVF